MRKRTGALLVAGVALLLATPSQAINCRQWSRLGPDQKAAAIEDMIQSALAGSGGRQYSVNRGAVERCLEGYAQSIEYAFDDACADPRTAGMQALRTIFKNYIWSCV